MKKYYFAGMIGVVAIVFISIWAGRDTRIVSIQPNEAVSVEFYNASSSASLDSEVQVMYINEQQDIVEVFNQLSKMKPNGHARPLDGNYTFKINKTDGSNLIYVYTNGVVTTSTGFKGGVQSDNVMNRLWAMLDYPVQNLAEEELPALG
ncbi:hypothetical protein [Cohnella nanjingensis]|uniref:Uncharacterized protein n=1 Tax=Cohnella nanjingensis TaxID=1387779 RepID=A0A7X0RMY5_9BACL|nr:hypothetical protein [Cohnella nanjingensis]MBB6670497.1 hypothetical protein [Cohnella nanjingensis]